MKKKLGISLTGMCQIHFSSRVRCSVAMTGVLQEIIIDF